MNEAKSSPAKIFPIPSIAFPAGILLAIILSISFLPTRLASPFINFLGLTVLIFTSGRIERGFLRIVWPLFGILVLGIVGSPGHLLHDILRDISFALNPIALIFLGYWMARNPGVRKLFFKVLVFWGLILAGLHLLIFIRNPELLRAGLEEVRSKAGAGSSLVALSLILLLFQHRFDVGGFLPRWVPRMLAIVLLAASLALSYSRTNILVAIILSLSLLGGLSRINFRMALAGLLFVGGMIGLIVLAPDNGKGTLRSKLLGSVTEVAISEHEDINTNWRGYEAYKAVEAFRSGNILQKTFGQGFGALVDVGFYILLGDTELRYIPVLHNGYAYILVKIGLLGVMLYALFYFQAIKGGVRNSFSANRHMEFYARLLVGCIWSLVMVMYVGGGMAQSAEPVFVILIGFLAHCIKRFHHSSSYPHSLVFSQNPE